MEELKPEWKQALQQAELPEELLRANAWHWRKRRSWLSSEEALHERVASALGRMTRTGSESAQPLADLLAWLRDRFRSEAAQARPLLALRNAYAAEAASMIDEILLRRQQELAAAAQLREAQQRSYSGLTITQRRCIDALRKSWLVSSTEDLGPTVRRFEHATAGLSSQQIEGFLSGLAYGAGYAPSTLQPVLTKENWERIGSLFIESDEALRTTLERFPQARDLLQELKTPAELREAAELLSKLDLYPHLFRGFRRLLKVRGVLRGLRELAAGQAELAASLKRLDQDSIDNHKYVLAISDAKSVEEVIGILKEMHAIATRPGYGTVQELREKGYLVCHAANAFFGTNTANPHLKSDPFRNIITDLRHLVEYNPSCSVIRADVRQQLPMRDEARLGGAIGIVLDQGEIYESYEKDVGSCDEVDPETGEHRRRGHDGMHALPLPVILHYSRYAPTPHNEVLLRGWSAGAIFCTDGIGRDIVGRLRRISDECSFAEYREPDGETRMKAFPIIEIRVPDNTWRLIHVPKHPQYALEIDKRTLTIRVTRK